MNRNLTLRETLLPEAVIPTAQVAQVRTTPIGSVVNAMVQLTSRISAHTGQACCDHRRSTSGASQPLRTLFGLSSMVIVSTSTYSSPHQSMRPRVFRTDNVPPLGAIELSGFNQLARLVNRGVDTAQVRKRGKVGQSVEDVGDTQGPRGTVAHRILQPPRSGRQCVLQSAFQRRRLDDFVQIGLVEQIAHFFGVLPIARVHLLHKATANLLNHLRQILPCEVGQQGTCRVPRFFEQLSRSSSMKPI